ncbi:MAG TPA: glycosyltransferase family 4 protein [Methylobacter sp.]|jgi:glycosyltransferase involved in cell wall biosynthesis
MVRGVIDNLLTALVLRWQRFNIRLPEVVLRPLRLLHAKLVNSKANNQGVEDWSTPLITRGETIAASDVSSEVARILESDSTLPSINLPDTAGLVVQPQNGLRCLLVTSALDVGGMDEVVVFLARGLPRYNIHTAVLHASVDGSVDGIPRGRLGRLLLERGVETVELAADQATCWLEAWRPDVISAHGAPSWVLEVAIRLSIPYLDTLHGMHSHFGSEWAAEAERSRRLTGIVAVSELVRQQYLNGNPDFPPERIVTIPNGVDDERRNPCDRNSFRERLGIGDEYLFVSLARHCLQKNTYGLVAAFEDVAAKHPEAHLVIAGHPSDKMYFNQVLSLRERLACRDRIHLRDHTPNPSGLLAAADGFVLDSFFEGWSLASMEALYVGVPVVLSEVGGAREQVGVNEERGHVIPNPIGDPLRVDWETMRKARFARQANREALVAAMSSLITDRAFWLNRRQQLIEESATRFHPDMCLLNHAQVLKAAVQGELLQYNGTLQGKSV